MTTQSQPSHLTKVIQPYDTKWGTLGDSTPTLAQRGARRLYQVAIITLAVTAVAWLIPNAFQGGLRAEFSDVAQWGPMAGLIVASALLIVAYRSRALGGAKVIRLGPPYLVIVSYCLAFSQYWGAFIGVPANQMNGDRVGIAYAGLWMLFFAVAVPLKPRHALIALLLSATAVPVAMAATTSQGGAPPLTMLDFFWLWAFPYLIVVAVAYVSARVFYQLGQDVKRAREMGSYRLEELLGEGGMGQVWRASHRMLARPAAVKLIRPDTLGGDAASIEGMMLRFEREAQVTANLQSAHTVELYDFGRSEDGTFYYVMELLDGIDLERLVTRFGPLPPERTVHILRQACASLSEAHRLNLVHRDIKPANIYVCKQAFAYDFVKLLDFGLVKRESAVDGADPGLSQVGLVGTPAYMAPEVILGKDPNGRADIYALGCVAFWMLTGRQVFEDTTVPALIAAHAHKNPPPPSTWVDSIPPEIDQVVLDCLVKDPDHRIADADDLVRRLDATALVTPWSSERAADWWKTTVGS